MPPAHSDPRGLLPGIISAGGPWGTPWPGAQSPCAPAPKGRVWPPLSTAPATRGRAARRLPQEPRPAPRNRAPPARPVLAAAAAPLPHRGVLPGRGAEARERGSRDGHRHGLAVSGRRGGREEVSPAHGEGVRAGRAPRGSAADRRPLCAVRPPPRQARRGADGGGAAPVAPPRQLRLSRLSVCLEAPPSELPPPRPAGLRLESAGRRADPRPGTDAGRRGPWRPGSPGQLAAESRHFVVTRNRMQIKDLMTQTKLDENWCSRLWPTVRSPV